MRFHKILSQADQLSILKQKSFIHRKIFFMRNQYRIKALFADPIFSDGFDLGHKTTKIAGL